MVQITDQGAGGEPLIFDPFIPALNMDASYTAVQIRMSGARVSKFEIKNGAKDNLSNDFPLFSYADVLMMKAEAMISQGQNGDEYINPIRVEQVLLHLIMLLWMMFLLNVDVSFSGKHTVVAI
jgi:starch-binding outer membrane protein, SusD/RagB family